MRWLNLFWILASVAGARFGQHLGCNTIFFNVAHNHWGDNLERAIKGTTMWCEEGSTFLLGFGILAGVLGGYLASTKGNPRLSPFVSLICGFVGAVLAAFLYAQLALP